MTHAVCGDARRLHAGPGHGEDAARGEALATNAELRALLALTDAAHSHLALDDLLRELLGRVTAVLGVDNVAILLLDEGSRTLTVRAARGPVEEEIGRTRIPVGQGFSGRIAANREPLIADDLATIDGVLPTMREHLRLAVDVPLLVMGNGEDRGEGQVVGRLGGSAPRGQRRAASARRTCSCSSARDRVAWRSAAPSSMPPGVPPGGIEDAALSRWW